VLGDDPNAGLEGIRGTLVGAARRCYLDQLRFCWLCLQTTLRYSAEGKESGGSGLVPVSADGAGAKFLESSWENGVLVFPCEHRREK
jgi:hypothetical protein